MFLIILALMIFGPSCGSSAKHMHAQVAGYARLQRHTKAEEQEDMTTYSVSMSMSRRLYTLRFVMESSHFIVHKLRKNITNEHTAEDGMFIFDFAACSFLFQTLLFGRGNKAQGQFKKKA